MKIYIFKVNYIPMVLHWEITKIVVLFYQQKLKAQADQLWQRLQRSVKRYQMGY